MRVRSDACIQTLNHQIKTKTTNCVILKPHPCQNRPTQADAANGQQSPWDLGFGFHLGLHSDLDLGCLELDSTPRAAPTQYCLRVSPTAATSAPASNETTTAENFHTRTNSHVCLRMTLFQCSSLVPREFREPYTILDHLARHAVSATGHAPESETNLWAHAPRRAALSAPRTTPTVAGSIAYA